MADFDGDGDRDVLVLAIASLRLLVNNGSGSFTPRADQGGLWPDEAYDVAVSDLDGDHDADLTVAIAKSGPDGEFDGTGRVGVLLNRGDGVFAPAILDDASGTTVNIVSADLDGDADPDAASNGNSIAATVFRNDGLGGLTKTGDFGVVFLATSIDAGDIDGDGDADLAFGDRMVDQVGVVRNAGNGTFSSSVFSRTAGRVQDVLLVDIDLDGDLDLLSANPYHHSVTLLSNQGDGSFAPGATFTTGGLPVHMAAADFDGDEWPDLAVADMNNASSVVLLLNNGSGFGPAIAVPAAQYPARVVQGDVNGDSRPDLAVLSSINPRVAILLANGNAFPAPPPPPPPIVLTVAGTTTKPRAVDLRWTGASGTNVGVQRNSIGIVLTPNDGQYTDAPPSKGTYVYQVCEPQPKRCSNQVTVSFNR